MSHLKRNRCRSSRMVRSFSVRNDRELTKSKSTSSLKDGSGGTYFNVSHGGDYDDAASTPHRAARRMPSASWARLKLAKFRQSLRRRTVFDQSMASNDLKDANTYSSAYEECHPVDSPDHDLQPQDNVYSSEITTEVQDNLEESASAATFLSTFTNKYFIFRWVSEKFCQFLSRKSKKTAEPQFRYELAGPIENSDTYSRSSIETDPVYMDANQYVALTQNKPLDPDVRPSSAVYFELEPERHNEIKPDIYRNVETDSYHKPEQDSCRDLKLDFQQDSEADCCHNLQPESSFDLKQDSHHNLQPNNRYEMVTLNKSSRFDVPGAAGTGPNQYAKLGQHVINNGGNIYGDCSYNYFK